MQNDAKLAVLHAKTDHDLLILIERELERGLALVKVEATQGSPLYVRAEKAYETVLPLSKIAGLSHLDRVRIEGKLKELRLVLDEVPALAKVLRSTTSVG